MNLTYNFFSYDDRFIEIRTLHNDFKMGYVLIWKLIDYPKTNITSCFCIKKP